MDSRRRGAENMKEGSYLWIFTIATGQNKSLFSLLNGKVSFGVVSEKKQPIGWIKTLTSCLSWILNKNS